MTWLVENPLSILLVGLALEAILLVVFLQMRFAVVLLAMLGVLLLTGALLLVERLVVTRTERVEQTLRSAAAAVTDGDVDRVLASISPDAPRLRALAKETLRQFTIDRVKIHRDLVITFNELTNPPKAIARFTAHCEGVQAAGQGIQRPFVGRFVVTLDLESDRWKVSACEYQPLTH